MYYFSPGDNEIKNGDHVIVETARGVEYGYVVLGSHEVEDKKVVQPLKPVLRMASPEDEEIERINKEKEKEAFRICLEKIKKHELEMKLIDTEYTFDNNKILFYFTADGRIDFRELVKDLASVFKTRGSSCARSASGMKQRSGEESGSAAVPFAALLICRNLYRYRSKWRRNRTCRLNPSKISGVCGRLMCCLKYEEETYEELNSRLPHIGDYVTTDDGLKGEVHSVSILRQLVKVIVTVDGDEKEIREYKASQLRFGQEERRKNHR